MKWPLLPQSEKSHPGLGLLQPATAESALMRKDSVERSGHLQVALIEVMGRVSADLNDREICNLLHSLSKMGVPWAAFPQTIQNGLLASFQRESRKLTGQQGSMTVYSFGLVGMNINRVPPAVRDNIFVVSMGVLDEALAFDKARLRTTEGRYIIQQTSNVIYGLAKQSANYYSLPQSMREKVSQAVVWCMGAMNEQEVSNTIYSHGVMGAVWDDLGEELHDVFRSSATRCLGNMITQGVSNTLYGMGLMQVRRSLSLSRWGIFLYTSGVLFHVEWCIRQPWCPIITTYINITSTAYNHHTDIYSLLNIYIYIYIRAGPLARHGHRLHVRRAGGRDPGV